MALLDLWARAASVLPRVTNFFGEVTPFSNLTKFAAGVSAKREMHRFATSTFRARFRKRAASQGKKVILWPDTFNNHFHREIAEAAVDVLEQAGYEVTIPDRSLCCGRPLYDFGWIGRENKSLRKP